jgi:hypothetical protein
MRPLFLLRVSLLLVSIPCLVVFGAAQTFPEQRAGQAGEDDARLAHLALELALVRHVREHLIWPEDGVSLHADRQDLAHALLRRPAAMPRTAGVGPAARARHDWIGDAGVVADVWHARVNLRQRFGMAGRAPLERLDRAHSALAASGALLGTPHRHLMAALQVELAELRRHLLGSGSEDETSIEMALVAADAAAAGRPITAAAAGGRPFVPPVQGSYGAGRPSRPGDREGAPPPGAYPPGAYPPGAASGGPPPPPASSSGGSAPLPPVYQDYLAQPASTVRACQAERRQAGEAATADAMLRVADCWDRQRAWIGWSAQVLEAVRWAAELSSIARDCEALDTVLQRVRTGGAPAAFPDERARL